MIDHVFHCSTDTIHFQVKPCYNQHSVTSKSYECSLHRMLHLYSQKSLLIVLHLLTFTEVRYVSFSWPMKFLYLKWSGSFLYEVIYLEHEEQLIFLPSLLHLQLCLFHKLVWTSYKLCYIIMKFRRPMKRNKYQISNVVFFAKTSISFGIYKPHRKCLYKVS